MGDNMSCTPHFGGDSRAEEVSELIDAVKALVVPFIASADGSAASGPSGQAATLAYQNGGNQRASSLADFHAPNELNRLLEFSLPSGEGLGKDGLLQAVQKVLRYSVNTWDQGFLDKLYSSTNAVGVASELLLSVLNTNVHVYGVSPVLTLVEKETAREFARLFGFRGPRAGGFTTSGGSASNLTSIVVARNTLYPETKTDGNGNLRFALFTSEHGHYSVEKAAQACGIGSSNVYAVPVDGVGRMVVQSLREIVLRAKAEGKTPLYVNATAGTTVLGSYDPFEAISAVCEEFGLWLHIDASWGGPAIFSQTHRYKLAGSHLADSLTVNPHKMMVRKCPLSCSFLLGPDTAIFHRANTLPAGYLFHANEGQDVAAVEEVWDLADLTLQCGRKGDSLKLALSWIYYGAAGYERRIDHAFAVAEHMARKLQGRDNFVLVSSSPPPCLQVCFYYAPSGVLRHEPEINTRRTAAMAARLLRRGFMVDYAPGEKGSFFRVVVNCETAKGTVDRLIIALEEVGLETTKQEA